MIRYDDFVPGTLLGEARFALTAEALGQWAGLFADDQQCAPAMPPAMIAMIVMRAYFQAVKDRPPGNIHAAQTFRIIRLPNLGTELITQVRCFGKEIKNDRRWIVFHTDTADAAHGPLFHGEMRTIWAA